MTQPEAVAWLNAQVGQYRDFDGQYGAQCVDLFNFYYQALTGRNPYSDGYGVPGAKDLWNVATDRFSKIGDSVSLVPQPGDVLIYGSSWGAGYGHVEMVVASNSNGCTVVGNNLTGNPSMPAQRVTRSWAGMAGLIGVMRFKQFNVGDIMDRQAVIDTYQVVRGSDPTDEDIRNWTGQPTMNLVRAFRPEANQTRATAHQTIINLQTALANEQSKPPKEVVKEVQKIVTEYVDRPVEVVKEVNPSWLEAAIQFIRNVLRVK